MGETQVNIKKMFILCSFIDRQNNSVQCTFVFRLAPVVFVLYLFLSFSTLFFLSGSSLIQLQATYGWTKPFFLAKGLK